MSNQKSFDPISIWKTNFKNMENYWGQSMEEQMKSEEFSEWMGKVLESNLFYKQIADTSTKQYLEQMNVPSREDLANLSSLVVNLDAKVDDLEEQLEENLDNQVSTSEMTQLKNELNKIDGKLDEVLSFINESQKSDENGKNNENR